MPISKHQALRLIIDNKAREISSSAAASNSRRAKSSIGKCQRPGMASRFRHIETADVFTERADATAPVPPKASMMSDADLIGDSAIAEANISHYENLLNPHSSHEENFECVNSLGALRRVGEYASMRQVGTIEYDGVAALERVARAVIGREPKQGDNKKIARFFDISESTVSNWKTRKSGLPFDKLVEAARRLNIDIYFLLGDTEERREYGAGALKDGSELETLRDELREMKERQERLESLISRAG